MECDGVVIGPCYLWLALSQLDGRQVQGHGSFFCAALLDCIIYISATFLTFTSPSTLDFALPTSHSSC